MADSTVERKVVLKVVQTAVQWGRLTVERKDNVRVGMLAALMADSMVALLVAMLENW